MLDVHEVFRTLEMFHVHDVAMLLDHRLLVRRGGSARLLDLDAVGDGGFCRGAGGGSALGESGARDQGCRDGGGSDFRKHGVVLCSIGLPQTRGLIGQPGTGPVVDGHHALRPLKPF
jgi:hypothetical protein